MDDAGVDARVGHELDRLVEAFELHAEIPVAVLVGSREVREHAVELQAAVEVDRLHEIDDVEVEHTDAVHAGVDAEMVLGDHPVQVGGLAERKRELGRGDRGHDVEREQKRDGAHRRLREDEDGRVDARLA